MAREEQETVWVSPPLSEERERWLQYNLFSLTNRLTTYRLEIVPYGQVGASPVQRDQLRGGLMFPLPLWPEFCEAMNHGKVVLEDRGLSSDYPDEPVGNGIPLCDREELLKTPRILDNWVQISLLHKTDSFGYQRRTFIEVISGGMGAARMPAEFDVASMSPLVLSPSAFLSFAGHLPIVGAILRSRGVLEDAA
jgi:hypothetical protein